MGEWDFLHGLSGQELQGAISIGATDEEWALIEAQDAKKAAETARTGEEAE